MPSTTIVVAAVVVLALLALVLLLRSRGKKEPEPRFEAPREIVPRPAKAEPKEAAVQEPAAIQEPAPVAPAPAPTLEPVHAPEPPPPAPDLTPPVAAAAPEPVREPSEVVPLSTEEIGTEQVVEAVEEPKPAPPPLRPAMRSYSNITDESVAEEVRRESAAPPPPPKPASEPKAAARPAVSEPKIAARPVVSEPKVPAAKPLPISKPQVPTAKPVVSEPKIAARPAISEPKVAAKTAVSEPKVAAKTAVSEPNIATAKPAHDEHDFSALNDAPAAKPASSVAATVAKFMPPANPATADLEKNDPRHAAARRLARISVSEIKLYHEDEVTAGREAKDLWKRLQQDIALAKQTFEARVVPEVRERFDYLYDEILRQLAEGDVAKLGPDAPAPKGGSSSKLAAVTTTTTAPPTAPPPPETAPAVGLVDPEAPTRTTRRTLEPAEPAPAPAPARVEPPKPVEAAPKPVEAAKPTGLAARALPSNPETAELEKNDPRHAAARRLARLSVSEIKLYHEDEVKAGREAKDLWKRMNADIGLATQTYEKRVDKDVRDRFDYLYDEILRQLAEGDVSKLGPEAPKSKAAAAAAPAAPLPPPPPAEPEAPKAEEPKPVVAPAPAPAPTPAATGLAGRFAPPSNPATAELEKNDPRHAAARRLARLSVSEIKLYHEDEVKAGREARDLWTRLTADIGLATQTYEKRVDREVRERFDYLYDEILRQLAEGDVAKLGPEAPKPKA